MRIPTPFSPPSGLRQCYDRQAGLATYSFNSLHPKSKFLQHPKSFAKHKCSLSFFGLKSLSAEVAGALAVHGGYIGLLREASQALEALRVARRQS